MNMEADIELYSPVNEYYKNTCISIISSYTLRSFVTFYCKGILG